MNKICPTCKTPIKILKHSLKCKCGIKLKTIKTIA